MFLPALAAIAMICASAGVASADKRATNPPPRNVSKQRRSHKTHGKYRLRISHTSRAKLRLSRGALRQAARQAGIRRPHKVGAVDRRRLLRYAGISLGVLLMAVAGIGWARRRGGDLARFLPPTLVAVTLLVGGALFARHVEANRAPVRVWARTMTGKFRVVPGAPRGTLRVHVPRAQLRRHCAAMGYRR